MFACCRALRAIKGPAGNSEAGPTAGVAGVSTTAPALEGKKATFFLHKYSTLVAFTLIYFLLSQPSALGGPMQDDVWFKGMVTEEDAKIMELSGKMVLLFEILRMAEDLGDKVYVSFPI